MGLVNDRRDFFLTILFIPVSDMLRENVQVVSWEKMLLYCEAHYATKRKAIVDIAINQGLDSEPEGVDRWIGNHCSSKATGRQNIRTALAEDGYKIIPVKFDGILVTNDPERIEEANNSFQGRLIGMLREENKINQRLLSINPKMPDSVLAISTG